MFVSQTLARSWSPGVFGGQQPHHGGVQFRLIALHCHHVVPTPFTDQPGGLPLGVAGVERHDLPRQHQCRKQRLHRRDLITTGHLEVAARLWGEARRAGTPTASVQALDGDVILAAQALSFGLSTTEYIVATSNIGHLSRFLPCDLWTNIAP